MRLHKRSSLRAFAAGLALCMTFGTTACSGESSQNDDASADSDAQTEQITPIEVVASVNQWISRRADRRRSRESHVDSVFD